MPTDTNTLSELIKNARIKKGYTQAQLAGLTGLSLRSIQRIENAKVVPRSYTLKALAGQLGLDLTEFSGLVPQKTERKQPSTLARKLILSITLGLVLGLLAGAFLSQTARFPETNFEYLLFWSAVVATYGLVVSRFWR